MFNENFPENKPRLNLKLLGIVSGVLILLLFVGVFAVRNIKNPNFSSDEEEPMVDFIDENSRLSGVQTLLGLGLSAEQYDSVVSKLESYFDKNYPEFRFIALVEDSLKYEEPSLREVSAGAQENVELPGDVARFEDDPTAEVFISEEELNGEARESDGAGNTVLNFLLRANSREEFTVKLDFSGEEVSLKIEKNA
ncbi:hypothetical protein IJ380_02760 [Candidatus Saccharibacteria bacterium]|nr:hypothetical protein [Candidatus Saccharibacteria bacterium]